MPWTPQEISDFRKLAGVYELPAGCFFCINIARTVSAKELPFMPEGVKYSWSVHMPGAIPGTRGPRMIGIDNYNDTPVRDACRLNPLGPQHRTHEHSADWEKPTIFAQGREWPQSGKGVQIIPAPASPSELFSYCMETLQLFFNDELRIALPDLEAVIASRLSEEDFLASKPPRRKP